MSNQKNNAALPYQQEFNKIIVEKVPQVLPRMLDGKFISATYPAGFNYGITYGSNGYYNDKTLSTLDSTIHKDEDGIVSLSTQKLSTLYAQVLKSSAFVFSQETQKKLNEWDNAAESQIASVLTSFTNSNFKFSDPLPPGGKIADVFNQLTTLYGPVTENCDNLPPSLSSLKNALSTYIELSNQSYLLHSRAAQATAIIKNSMQNTTNPNKGNNALQTGDNSYYPCFDKLPTANQLRGSLGTDSNAFSIHLEGNSFTGETCKLHFDSSSEFVVPIFGLLGIELKNSSQVDISNYTHQGTTFSIDITYSGLTIVNNIPLSLSTDNKTGWYASNLLYELKHKTDNPNVDGYKLIGTEFSVDELFGENGRLNYFKTFVISKTPTVNVTFSNININEYRKHINTASSVKVNLFNFITIGEVNNSYTLDHLEFNESSQSVTMKFQAPDISGTIPLEQQIAYVLGGVSNHID